MKKRALGLAAALAAVFAFCGAGCKDGKTEDIKVYMPDGAPALALAKLMCEDKEDDGVRYFVVDPKEIKTKVTYTDLDKNADLCVLPLTAATKLLGKGEEYQMLGAVTHGNLYLLGKGTETYDERNISELSGKTVGVLQLNDVPGVVFKTVLQKYGLSSSVTLNALTGAGGAFSVTDEDYYVLGEPAASAQKAKGYSIVGNLQTLYGGEDGYPQAVLVAKRSIIEENGEWLTSFVRSVAAGAAWLETAGGEEIVAAVTAHLEDEGYSTTLKPALLTAEVLGRCGVRFEQAKDCKGAATAFLASAREIGAKAVTPDDGFYYTENIL